MVEIYILSHPITKEVRYVGKANDHRKRLKSHIRDSRRRKTPVCCWIKHLTGQKLIPEIKVIRTIEVDQWEATEKQCILEYRLNGFNLLNVAAGGAEPFCPTKVRARNGRNNILKINANPRSKKLHQLKRNLASNLNTLKQLGRTEAVERIISKLTSKGIYV